MSTPVKKKIDPVKKKRRKINNSLVLVLIVISLVTIGAFGYNIYKVMASQSTGEGTTLTTTGNSSSNDLYTIGNNPTDIEQTYFKELTDAVKAGDKKAMATAVIKNFITDYYTWTNKDGNYEIGGLQYIYGQKTGAFETFSRWNFYADLDLYISQYGRDNLLQVKEVTATDAVAAPDFVIKAVSPEVTLSSYYVEATWTYESSSKIDVNSFQHTGYFYLVDNDGRIEIAEFYGED